MIEDLRVNGRFLQRGSARTFLRMVTYGPFPFEKGNQNSSLRNYEEDFTRILSAGFEAIRMYHWPSAPMLAAAERTGLKIWAGLEWPQAVDFRSQSILKIARKSLTSGLEACGTSTAMEGVFVANEIPSDLVRWMGVNRTRQQLEALIAQGKDTAPHLLWAYANYPSTEYLEPGNADLTAMNVYLEREADFRSYLRRLHHIAGDRPLILSEFGLDSRRNGAAKQADTLAWAVKAAREEGMSGFTAYAWSDCWWNAGEEILDWDFGLVDRKNRAKPVLTAVAAAFKEQDPPTSELSFSVIICTRNGKNRLTPCLQALQNLHYPSYEVIVVDDGSDDGTAAFVKDNFPEFCLIEMPRNVGLSAARNAGAKAAKNEVLAYTDDDCQVDPDWLAELAKVYASAWDACGGPNLPPPPEDWQMAVIAAAPGAASHVMLNDEEAEHIPGCNLSVRADAFHAIGGFDPQFRTAGDDVDFCWRLQDAGYRIGFAPNAWVWHDRRPSIYGYVKQQIMYGKAEALLHKKHPQRFTTHGDARWHGVIYSGAPVRALRDAGIYHGPMATAGYQYVINHVQPSRNLDPKFSHWRSRLLLALLQQFVPLFRAYFRIDAIFLPTRRHRKEKQPSSSVIELAFWDTRTRLQILNLFLTNGWEALYQSSQWDLKKDNTKVLIACELHDKGAKRILIRIRGDENLVRTTLPPEAEIRHHPE